jgi:drug/metabolite transporter (DMT)-like permease
MSIWFALLLVSLCAVLWDASIALQKLAVDGLPRIDLGRGLPRAVGRLLASGKWMAGLAASAAGWGLFVFALSFTPVSVARAILGSGFVILALFSVLFLHHRLRLPEWCGVVLITVGIAALGISGSSAAPARQVSIGGVSAAAGICLLVCAAASALPAALHLRVPRVIVFSIVAGTLLGLGDVATKTLIGLLQRQGFGLQAAAVGAGLIVVYISGFLVLSRSYQHGRAILVTAVSDLCSRLVAIVVGITALGEALAADPALRVVQVLGYAAIITGAVLLARFSGSEIASTLSGSRASRGFAQAAESEPASPAKVDTHH